MAIYGQYAKITLENQKYFEFDFINFLSESTKTIENLFNIDTLNEETSAIETKLEEKKKTIFEIIKKAIQKFFDAVKELITKLIKSIEELYLKVNFVDNIVGRNKNKITYPNLIAAKEKGWEGLSDKTPCIGKIFDMYDSKMAFDLMDSIKNDNYKNSAVKDLATRVVTLDDISEIIKSETYDQAEEKYNELSEISKKFSLKHKEFLDEINEYYDVFGEHERIYENGDVNKPFVVMKNMKNNHYFPTQRMFENVKDMAEHGQEMNKRYRSDFKSSLSKSIDERKLYKNDVKINSKITETERDKIYLLYCKAKYEWADAYLYRIFNNLKFIMKIRKQQHIVCIRTYSEFAKAINKYQTA